MRSTLVAASMARLAGTAVNVKLFLKAAARAIGVPVVADRGAAGQNCVVEYGLDAGAEALCSRGAALAAAQGPRFRLGRQPRAEQRLANIDVA